jgi:protocatechuate 3,4-dioxygenase beta subunit
MLVAALSPQGTVFGLTSKTGLPYAVLDVWQASPDGKYDYEEKCDPFCAVYRVLCSFY